MCNGLLKETLMFVKVGHYINIALYFECIFNVCIIFSLAILNIFCQW